MIAPRGFPGALHLFLEVVDMVRADAAGAAGAVGHRPDHNEVRPSAGGHL